MRPHGQIVEHLTWQEVLHTDHREFLEEQANPSQTVIRNFTRHAQTIWAPMRKLWGPTLVTSGIRCAELNHAVGGAVNSRHVTGHATDNIPLKMDLFEAFELLIHSDIPFDVAIWEYGHWIHVHGTVTASGTPRKLKRMKFKDTPKSDPYEIWNPADPRVQKVARKRTPVHLNGVADGPQTR